MDRFRRLRRNDQKRLAASLEEVVGLRETEKA
jgi:hypothetical protein